MPSYTPLPFPCLLKTFPELQRQKIQRQAAGAVTVLVESKEESRGNERQFDDSGIEVDAQSVLLFTRQQGGKEQRLVAVIKKSHGTHQVGCQFQDVIAAAFVVQAAC